MILIEFDPMPSLSSLLAKSTGGFGTTDGAMPPGEHFSGDAERRKPGKLHPVEILHMNATGGGVKSKQHRLHHAPMVLSQVWLFSRLQLVFLCALLFFANRCTVVGRPRLIDLFCHLCSRCRHKLLAQCHEVGALPLG